MSRVTLTSRYSILSITESTSDDAQLRDDIQSVTATNFNASTLSDSEIDYSSDSSATHKETENANITNFFQLWKDLPTITQFGKPSKKVTKLPKNIDIDVEMEEGSWGSMVPDLESIEKELEETDDDEKEKLEEEEEEAYPPEIIDQIEEEQPFFAEQQAEEEEVESESTSESSESSADMQLPEYDDEISPTQAAMMREEGAYISIDPKALEMLTHVEAHKDIVEHHITKQNYKDKVKQAVVEDFLNFIIKKVIDVTEKVNTEVMLRLNLDKRKLIKNLLLKHQDYNNELKLTDQLQKKVVEYCRRKKLIRFLTADNAKTIEFEKNKLTNNMIRLDGLLKIQQDIEEHLHAVHSELTKEYDIMKKKSYSQAKVFENLLKETCNLEARPRLLEMVNQQISAMNKLRENINETCFKMLLQLDKKANLIEQISELEDLGNSLNMADFVNLQSKILNLDKKIEERNDELLKLHLRSRKNIHSMAHYQEKQRMIRNMTIYEALANEELFETERILRNKIYKSKLLRNAIKKTIEERSYQAGLLDKPIIMLDYDKTVSSIRKETDTIKYLRRKQKRIQNALDQLTMKYDKDIYKGRNSLFLRQDKNKINRDSKLLPQKDNNFQLGLNPSLQSVVTYISIHKPSL